MTEYVWIVARANDDGKSWECNGICTSKELALSFCHDERTQAVRMPVDQDCAKEFSFLVCSPSNPEGEMTSGWLQ